VVGDDDLHAERAGVCDLVHGRDPAVDRHQQVRARRRLALHARHRQAVSVVEAAGELAHRRGAEPLERTGKHRGRAHAVHVVVPVDNDARATRDVAHEDVDRGREAGHQSGIVAVGCGEEPARGLRGVVAAPDEDRGGYGMKPELPRQRMRSGDRIRVTTPACGRVGHRPDGRPAAGWNGRFVAG
jgi:hypothetical protein